MTPDGCRGSFHVNIKKEGFVGDGLGAVPWLLVLLGQRPHFLYLPDPSERLVPGTAERTKKGPEKSGPTPLSYHSLRFKSMLKSRRAVKICALHKNDCLHLGNIPS